MMVPPKATLAQGYRLKVTGEALVRSVLREPLPPSRRLSGRRGGLGLGDRGGQ
jgi:hypothetical protein